MRAKFLTTTNVTYWGTVLGSNEGVYVLLGLCRRNPYNSGREKNSNSSLATVGRRVLASISRRGFTAPDSPESPRYYASSPYGVVRPHHLGVFVTLRAGVISLPER